MYQLQMDPLVSLHNELLKLEQTVKTFKIGATAVREQTIEEKITEAVKALTLADAKLLTVKTKIEEAKQSLDEDPVDVSDLVSLLDTYEKELAKFALMKSLWQHCIEASGIHGMRTGDTPVDEETFRFVDESLMKIAKTQIILNDMMVEEEQVSQQIMEKKEELKTSLRNYEEKLEEIKQRKKQLESRETESLEQRKRMESKLEKLNTMSILMMNLLSMSEVNYVKHPKWNKLLLQIQNPVTMQELASEEI